MSNTNVPNPITEAALIIISVALIAAATALFILGKIDYTGCIAILGMVLALWGANSLYKAPSPSQQTQINAQQQSVQDMLSQLMNVLPVLFQVHSHPVPVATPAQPAPVQQPAPLAPPPPAPVATPQPVQQVPFPPQATPAFTLPPTVARSFGDTSSMPTVQ